MVLVVVVVFVAVVDGFVAVGVGATAPSILFVDVVPPAVHSDWNDDDEDEDTSSDAAAAADDDDI